MRKKIVITVIVIAALAGVLLLMHLLVNYFDLFSFMKAIHGG
jgi:hypothetical protein